jgi:hypothetical protein
MATPQSRQIKAAPCIHPIRDNDPTMLLPWVPAGIFRRSGGLSWTGNPEGDRTAR